MAFLKPEYSTDPFVRVTTASDESEVFPADALSDRELRDAYGEDAEVERIEGKVWARLSAPGYLDCTIWSGPHDTLDAAKAALSAEYDVDPETGDALDD